MDSNSEQEKVDLKKSEHTAINMFSPRRKEKKAEKISPERAVELFFAQINKVEDYTKRIEKATERKVGVDEESLGKAAEKLCEPLKAYEKQAERMRSAQHVDIKFYWMTSVFLVLALVITACFAFAWSNAAAERDYYKAKCEIYEMAMKK